EAGARAAAACGIEEAAGAESAHLAAVRQCALHARPGARLRADVGALSARRGAGSDRGAGVSVVPAREEALPAPPALARAVELHRARKLDQAERLYRYVLEREPRHADALGMLGLLFYQSGRAGEGVTATRAALRIEPCHAGFHGNLGNMLRGQGRWEEAIVSYREAIRLAPGDADGHIRLGNVLMDLRELGPPFPFLEQARP